jgi:lipoate-protein ligase B
MRTCLTVQLGRTEYAAAWELQRRLAQRVADGELPGVLLLLEHPHVYTLGRRGKMTDILVGTERLQELGIAVHATDRGGEVTYHGPEQLVGYPIVDIRPLGGPLAFVHGIEAAIVATLAEFGIQAERGARPTGVWVGDAKIAAIGLKVSRGVSMHGFALNVAPDLSYFDHIVPCGMPGSRVTSMAWEAGVTDVSLVAPVLVRHLANTFGWQVTWSSPESITASGPSVLAPSGR